MPKAASFDPFSISHKHGDDYATWLIKQKAGELVGHFGFTEDDRDDIEQELVLDLLQRWPKFDPVLGKPSTFIRCLVNHRVSTLIRNRTTEERLDEQFAKVSIDAEVEEEVSHCRRRGGSRRIEQEEFELREDVLTVLEQLPPDLRDICERLKTDNASCVARELGIPLPTLLRKLSKIRQVFESLEIDLEF